MMNATLRGKPDAGNLHVRFDEGEVASAKPRRGSLLYRIKWLMCWFAASMSILPVLAANVSNVQACQRAGTGFVDITYDLYAASGGTVDIQLSAIDYGESLVVSSCSGDIGNVRPGNRRHIVWDAVKDNPGRVLAGIRMIISGVGVSVTEGVADIGMAWLPLSQTGYKYRWYYTDYWSQKLYYYDSTSGGGFYISREPVSSALWVKVYKWAIEHGYKFDYSYSSTAGAAYVSPRDAVVWCNARSAMEGLPLCFRTSSWSWSSKVSKYSDTYGCQMLEEGGYRLPYMYEMCMAWVSKGCGIATNKTAIATTNHSLLWQGGDPEGLAAYSPKTPSPYPAFKAYTSTSRGYFHCVRDKVSRVNRTEVVPPNYSNEFSIDLSVDKCSTTVDFKIERITSKYCSGRYGDANKATFLSGIALNVDFEAETSGGTLARLLVGDSVVSKTGEFSIDVGAMAVGAEAIVRAVSIDGRISPPYRLNFDIASPPPPLPGYHLYAFCDDHVVYQGPRYSSAFLESGVNDQKSIKAKFNGEEQSIDVPMSIAPAFSLEGWMSSKDGKEVVETGWGAKIGRSGNGVFTEWEGFPMVTFCGVYLTGQLMMSPCQQWNPDSCKWESCSTTLGIKIEGGGSVTHYILPQFMIYVKGTIRGSAYLEGEWSAGDRLAITADWVLPNIRLVLGGGLSGFACIEGYGDASLNWKIRDWLIAEQYLVLDAGFQATLFGCVIPGGNFHKEFWFVPQGNDELLDLGKIAEPDPHEVAKTPINPIARDYLTNPPDASGKLPYLPDSGSVVTGSVYNLNYGSATKIQNNGYPQCRPACTGRGDVFVEYDDSDRQPFARTVLTHSKRTTPNKWDVGKTIWDDGTADYGPSTTRIGDTGAVAWMNVGSVDEIDTLGDELAAMEIAVATKGESEEEWVSTNLTSDTSFDHSPVLKSVGTNHALVVWISNAYTNYLGSIDEPNAILYSEYDGKSWTRPKSVVEGVGKLRGLSLATAGDDAVIAYAECLGATQTVRVVRRNEGVWGAPLEVAELADCGGIPFATCETGGMWQVYWNETGSVHRVCGGCDAALVCETLDTCGVIIPTDAAMANSSSGSVAIVWTAQSETETAGATDMFLMTYNPISGAWSMPTKIVKGYGYYQHGISSAFSEDDSLEITYASSLAKTNDAGIVSASASDVAVVVRKHAPEVGIVAGSVCLATNEFSIGVGTQLLFDIVNYGDTQATNVTVAVYDNYSGLGRLTNEVVAVLAPREKRGYVVDWNPRQVPSRVNLSIHVSSRGQAYSLNSSYTFDESEPIISLSSASGREISNGCYRVTATLRNDGSGTLLAGTSVNLVDDNGETLGVCTVGAIKPGADGQCDATFDVPATQLDFSNGYTKMNVVATLPTNDTAAVARTLQSAACVKEKDPLDFYALSLSGTQEGAQEIECRYDSVVSLPTNEAKVAGCEFCGWSLSTTGGVVYADGAKVINPPMYEKDKSTLYAVWSEIRSTRGLPVDVPFEWLSIHYPDITNSTDDADARIGGFAEAARRRTGKRDAAGNDLCVWHDYVAGTNPNDTNDVFTATITFEGGTPNIQWRPALNGQGVKTGVRTYRIFGVRRLGEEWEELDGNEKDYNFFKVSVEL